VEKLLVLQDRDRRIARLARESQDVPARKHQIEASVERERKAVSNTQDQIKKRQSDIKQVELEIQSRREKILKLREQQFQVKSNDDYRTLDREVKDLERQIREIEDRELEVMESLEALRKDLAEHESELKRGEKRVVEETGTLDQRLREIESEISRLQAERSGLAKDVDADWLSRYERVLQHHRDYALVPIENGTCGGCHMKLPPQLCHDARKGLSMTLCGFCSRMLYWQP